MIRHSSSPACVRAFCTASDRGGGSRALSRAFFWLSCFPRITTEDSHRQNHHMLSRPPADFMACVALEVIPARGARQVDGPQGPPSLSISPCNQEEVARLKVQLQPA